MLGTKRPLGDRRGANFNQLPRIGAHAESPSGGRVPQNPSEKEDKTTTTFGGTSGVNTVSRETTQKAKQARDFKDRKV